MAVTRPQRSAGLTQGTDTAQGVSAAWAIVLIVLLSGAVPAFLVSDVPDAGRSNAWIVTLGIMVWAGLRLGLLCVSGRAHLFDFFFWLFAYIFMGLAPTVQLRSNEIAITTPRMDPALDMPAAVTVVVGLVAYEVGRVIAASRPGQRSVSVVEARDDAPPLDVNKARAVSLTLIGLLFTAYFVSRIGLGSLFTSRQAASTTQMGIWPDPAVRSIVDALSVYPLLIGAGAFAQIRVAADSVAWRRVGLVGLLGAALLLGVVENPIVTARYVFGTVAFAIAVYLGAVRTAFRVRATMLATFGGFIFLFPLADAFRYAGEVRSSRGGFFGEYLANGDYDAFWQIANAYDYWQAGLVVPLRQLSGSMLFWVPRAVWPNKPTDTGILLAQYRGYSFTNLSAPLWAESLVNAGIVGVLVVFVLLGYTVVRMDRRLSGVFATGGVWGIAGAVFPVYMVILLRGSLLQATGAVVIAIACILFIRRTWSLRPRHPTYSDSS